MMKKLKEQAKWLKWLYEFKREWSAEPSAQGMAIIDAEIESAIREMIELAGGNDEGNT